MTAPVMVGPSLQGGGPVPRPDWQEALAIIGCRVRTERKARGWSVPELARRANLSPHTVRRLEHSADWTVPLLKVSSAFRLPVAYLMSDRWQEPARLPSLAPRQAEVLREAASGDGLEAVGARLGMRPHSVGAELSRIYTRLGVAGLPRDERRSAAVRVAMQHGLFTPPNRTS